jgi:CRISPR-associated protein Cst2
MSWHLFGTVLTAQAVAHNNRGESEGTISTLQKVIRNGDIHSTVSCEAIRYAMREMWAEEPGQVNRDVRKPPKEAWADKEFKDQDKYLDNDVLGFMHAKKETVSRRGILEISRAVSTTPWPGTMSSHFASPGSNPAVASEDPIPYQAEIHDTRYQFSFAMTPASLLKQRLTRTRKTLLTLQNLCRVAGNHARFLFDFSPEAIVLRWTHDPAPRLMFCYEQDESGALSLSRLLARCQGDEPDIPAKELIIGTTIPNIEGLDHLRALGASVHLGVKAAVSSVLARVAEAIQD